MDEREGWKVGERRGGEEGEKDASKSLYDSYCSYCIVTYKMVFVFVSSSLTCRR